jgi:hypothetical protein
LSAPPGYSLVSFLPVAKKIPLLSLARRSADALLPMREKTRHACPHHGVPVSHTSAKRSGLAKPSVSVLIMPSSGSFVRAKNPTRPSSPRRTYLPYLRQKARETKDNGGIRSLPPPATPPTINNPHLFTPPQTHLIPEKQRGIFACARNHIIPERTACYALAALQLSAKRRFCTHLARFYSHINLNFPIL